MPTQERDAGHPFWFKICNPFCSLIRSVRAVKKTKCVLEGNDILAILHLTILVRVNKKAPNRIDPFCARRKGEGCSN